MGALEGLSRGGSGPAAGLGDGSVEGRLERGREMLRKRLEMRGLTVPAVLAGGVLVEKAEALPAALVAAVTRAAMNMPATALPVKAVFSATAVLLASALEVAPH